MSLTDWAIFGVVVVAMIALVRGSRVPIPPEVSDEFDGGVSPEISDGSSGGGTDGGDGD